MKVARAVASAAIAAGVTAQIGGDSFESPNFNVTTALQRLGVAVEMLPTPVPETSVLGKQSLFAPCSLAASCSSLYKTYRVTGADDGCSVCL